MAKSPKKTPAKMRERCARADRYKGLHEPRCGCLTCWRRWVAEEKDRAAYEQSMREAGCW